MSAPIVLVGFMAAGKTTVGRLLAARLGWAYLDLDELITFDAGRAPAELIAARGEVAFRRVETAALARALQTRNTVLATGGGAVLSPRNRRLLARAAGRVVWLKVSAEEAWRRAKGQVGPGAARPVLPPSLDQVLELLAAREPSYAAAATEVRDTDGVEPAAVAAAIAAPITAPIAAPIAAATPPPDTRAEVLGGGPEGHGPVLVGSGLLGRLAQSQDFPRDVSGPVLLLCDPLAGALYGERVTQSLTAEGLDVRRVVLPSGEKAKTASGLARLWEAMADARLERSGLVVSLGGGATTDAVGFAASTYMRGVRVVHLPTTLLAQVDAAVGGKTAVNLPQGKNLAGTFHFPRLVVADVDVCRTLGPALVAEGLVELFKTMLVTGTAIAVLRGRLAEPPEGGVLAALVADAVRAKLALTRSDPFDRGARAALNLGHTFGHGLEAEAGFGRIRHGLAVAVGFLAACRLSALAGRLPEGLAEPASALALELISLFPAEARRSLRGLDPGRVLAHLELDKKKARSGVVYILLQAAGVTGSPGGGMAGPSGGSTAGGPGAGALEPVAAGGIDPALAGEALAWALLASGT